jgi:hypothetical protein
MMVEINGTPTFINIKELGAVGDGVTDDTAAIKTAIDKYSVIYIPKGSYVYNGKVSLKRDTTIISEGASLVINNIEGTNYWYKAFDASNYNLAIENLNFEINLPSGLFPDGTTTTYRFILLASNNSTVKVRNSTINIVSCENQTNVFYFYGGTKYELENITCNLDSTGYNGAICWSQTNTAANSGTLRNCTFTQVCRDEIIGLWGNYDNSMDCYNVKILRLNNANTDPTAFVSIRANNAAAKVDAIFTNCYFENQHIDQGAIISCHGLVKMTTGYTKSVFNSCTFKVKSATDSFLYGTAVNTTFGFGYTSYEEFEKSQSITLNNCDIDLETGFFSYGTYPICTTLNNCKLKLPETSIKYSGGNTNVVPYTLKFNGCKITYYNTLNNNYRRLMQINPNDGIRYLFLNCEIELIDISVNYRTCLITTVVVTPSWSTNLGGAYFYKCYSNSYNVIADTTFKVT